MGRTSPAQHQDLCLLPVAVAAVAAAAVMQAAVTAHTAQCSNDRPLKQLLRLLQHSQGNERPESVLGRVQRWPREASFGCPGRNCPLCFSTAVMDTPIPALALALALTAAVISAMLRPLCTETR